MNYGAIGFVIGHEITHGFDDQGRQFDKDGNLVDWWAPSTKEQYLKRAECIIHQYGNYTVEEVGLNVSVLSNLIIPSCNLKNFKILRNFDLIFFSSTVSTRRVKISPTTAV